jgi:hypothetical protein
MNPSWWQTILAYWNALPTWVTTLLLCFGGAAYNYLDTVPSAQLLSELTTASGLWTLAKGALVAGLAGVALLVKQSFLQKIPTLTEIRMMRAARKMQRGFIHVGDLLAAVGIAAISCVAAVVTLDASGCTPAQQAQAVNVTGVVLSDLLAGKDLPTIEADVTRALAGAGVVVTDIAAIVEDALNLLLDAGLVPPSLLPRAADLKAQAHVARKGSAVSP